MERREVHRELTPFIKQGKSHSILKQLEAILLLKIVSLVLDTETARKLL